MSFDVYVYPSRVEGATYYWTANYTSNVGAFFAWALDGVDAADPQARSDSRDGIFGKGHTNGLGALSDTDCFAAEGRLRLALERIDGAPPGSLAKYNPANGWGDVVSATDYLRRILKACRECPHGYVYVSL